MRMIGKVALVTGASRGIGRGIAIALAREGADLILTSRQEADLANLEAELAEFPGKRLSLAGDLTSADFVNEMFQKISDQFGRVDLVINNAGIAPYGPIEDVPVEVLQECLDINLVAVYRIMRESILLMRRTTNTGRILNISSVRAHWTMFGECGVYNAAKYGLRAMTETVARQMHGTDTRITVGMISPGLVDTRITNPEGEEHPDWVSPDTIGELVVHIATAPDHVNIFDTIVFPITQEPW